MIILLVFLHCITASFCFSEKEIKVVSTLIQSLIIKRCVIVNTFEHELDQITSIKTLSDKNIMAASTSLVKLEKLISQKNFQEYKSVILLTVKNDLQLKKVLEQMMVMVSDVEICSKFVWILLMQQSEDGELIDIEVPFDCELFFIQKNKAQYSITEVYGENNASKKLEYGYCDSHHGLQVSKGSIYQRRNNLEGEIMVLDSFAPSKEAMCVFVVPCIHYQLWQDMGRIFNFHILLASPEDLARNVSLKPSLSLDIAFFYATEKDLRHGIGPVLGSRTHIYIKDIGQDTSAWNIYLKPFGDNLWLVILYWILVSSSIIIVISCMSTRKRTSRKYTLLDEGLTPYNALCNQNCSLPLISSLRIAKIAILVVSGVLVPAFSAFVVSFLTVDRPIIPFTDLNTFVNDGTYKLAALGIPLLKSFFQETNDPVLKVINEKHLFNIHEFPLSYEKSVEMICSIPKLAIINFNYKMLQIYSPCKIKIIPKDFMRLPSAMMLKNNGVQYRRLFLDALIRFRSSGIIDKEEKRLFGKTDFPQEKEIKPIESNTIKSVMAFLSIGICSSFIFLLIEIIFYYSISKIRRKNRTANCQILFS